MLRNPLERFYSGYQHHMHDCRACVNEGPNKTTFADYVAKVGSLYAEYFGRGDADVAKKRIETDFAFVGLVEHWGASVCLYHATFGGRAASKVELRNLRPGGYEAPENLASLRQGPGQGLGGHAAENLRRDFVVYAAGKSKFLSDLAARAGVD